MSASRRRAGCPDLEHYYDAATDRASIADHIAACPDCRAWLADIDARLRDLPCNQLVELVTAYLDDALDDRLRARIEDHLRLCEGCRTYLGQMRATLATMRRIDQSSEPSEAVQAGLLAAFRNWRLGSSDPKSRPD
jgi:predicted anti-sigma-YlaC factor YlaD